MINHNVYTFYYNKMCKNERVIYDALVSGISSHKKAIFMLKSKDRYPELICDVFEKVLYDHPEVFYVKGIRIEILPPGILYRIIPDYRFMVEEVNYLNCEIEKKVEEFIANTRNETDLEKERLIHDYIISLAKYKDMNAPYCHEIPGILLYGIGVCEGFSKAFKYFCDRLGLKAGVIAGYIRNDGELHAWNGIYIENKWFNVDVTFDTCISRQVGELKYEYYNLPDDLLTDRIFFES